MRKLYVIDTNGIISYFMDVFQCSKEFDGSPDLSKNVRGIISEAISSSETNIRVSIPTIVFVEIYEKWLKSEEFCRTFFYNVFTPLKQSNNIEIKPTDRDVLENLLRIGGSMENHDLHDRLVLASAMSLEAPLITSDSAIIKYVKESNVVPSVCF